MMMFDYVFPGLSLIMIVCTTIVFNIDKDPLNDKLMQINERNRERKLKEIEKEKLIFKN